MITRKHLIEKLKAMDTSTVLFEGWRRTTNNRGYAVEQALKSLIGNDVTFGHSTHCKGKGKLTSNPKWFKQLFTEIMWATGDVTVASVLAAL